MPATSTIGFTEFHVDDSMTPPHIACTIYTYDTKIAMRIAKQIMRFSMRPVLINDSEHAQYKEQLLVDLVLNIKHSMYLHALGNIETGNTDLIMRNMQFMYAMLHDMVYNPYDEFPRRVCNRMLCECGMMFNCPPYRGFAHGSPAKWFVYGILNKSHVYRTASDVLERDKHVFVEADFIHLTEALLSYGITPMSNREKIEQAVYQGCKPSNMETYATILPSYHPTILPSYHPTRRPVSYSI
jgi:hypothetical protein